MEVSDRYENIFIKSFNISVSDANDAPVITPANISVYENSEPGVVARVDVHDSRGAAAGLSLFNEHQIKFLSRLTVVVQMRVKASLELNGVHSSPPRLPINMLPHGGSLSTGCQRGVRCPAS